MFVCLFKCQESQGKTICQEKERGKLKKSNKLDLKSFPCSADMELTGLVRERSFREYIGISQEKGEEESMNGKVIEAVSIGKCFPNVQMKTERQREIKG